MIALNGLIGLSLLLGGLHHHEQHYNCRGERLSQYHHGAECARLGPAQFHYFHVRPEVDGQEIFLPVPDRAGHGSSEIGQDQAEHTQRHDGIEIGARPLQIVMLFVMMQAAQQQR